MDFELVKELYDVYSELFNNLNLSLDEFNTFMVSEIQYLRSINLGDADSLEYRALYNSKSLSKEEKEFIRTENFISGFNGVNDSMNRFSEYVFNTKDVGLDISNLPSENHTGAAGAVIPKLSKIVDVIDFDKNEDLFKYFYSLVFEKIALIISDKDGFESFGESDVYKLADILYQLNFDEIFPNESILKDYIKSKIIKKINNSEVSSFYEANRNLIDNAFKNKRYDDVITQQMDYAINGDIIDLLRIPDVINGIASSLSNGALLNGFVGFDTNGNATYIKDAYDNIIKIIENGVTDYVERAKEFISNNNGERFRSGLLRLLEEVSSGDTRRTSFGNERKAESFSSEIIRDSGREINSPNSSKYSSRNVSSLELDQLKQMEKLYSEEYNRLSQIEEKTEEEAAQ